MLKLEGQKLHFSFPEVHPDAEITIEFQRTLRIPDDGNIYPLPPGLGRFPTKLVDEFKNKVPQKWVKHGGIMIPMYQSEAMWINFSPKFVSGCSHQYPFAVKVATGKQSAITGKKWSSKLKARDYVVCPEQRWLDGYVIEDGKIRQFIAAPLGAGFTAEEQITGKAEFGGLQIEVIPMKAEVFQRRYPIRSNFNHDSKSLRRCCKDTSTVGISNKGMSVNSATNYSPPGVYTSTSYYSPQLSTDHLHIPQSSLFECNNISDDSVRGLDFMPNLRSSELKPSDYVVADMGLAPGGMMQQQVIADPYDLTDWETTVHDRCFVHLLNSIAWKAVTGQDPPTIPLTASDYSQHGMPWFEYYHDGKSVTGSNILTNLKSATQLGKEKGFPIIPENITAHPQHVVNLSESVRSGNWTK